MKPLSLPFELSCGFWNALVTAKISKWVCCVVGGRRRSRRKGRKREGNRSSEYYAINEILIIQDADKCLNLSDSCLSESHKKSR